ncbi:amino acid ABC transporter substrate-binding protein, PAAT family [Pseudomonas asplenii]|uniref:Amino acid ABC transporter substrate-binding protein, PAAT family n=2 Tax=Pseudomonas asplenii TaxID=53407 RepID=A0A1H2A2G9_9PSED|nr:amino acid ABC transporter substrate-binding protein, PAAT family [Pseudomonas asplenii]SEI15602.1 amino acid ABC transporter substrate-binding protein, PAAT family [Pseudomonas fuscovaginae]
MKLSPVRRAFRIPGLVLGVLMAQTVWAAQEVRIGAAHFPPYTIRPEQGADTGLLPQLAEALNALQGDYHFVLVPTSIPRRFRDFEEGRTDMAIFENPQWGWKGIAHVNVDMGLEDAEVFVAQRRPDRTQSYFADLKGKRLALFSGYHYEFAHFNADPKYLAETHNATLTYSHDSNLLMVLRGRADIALVTRSYLFDYLSRNPGTAKELLISERVDQVYHHYALLRPKAPISGEAFSQLLERLRSNGELLKIFQPYRIEVMPTANAVNKHL